MLVNHHQQPITSLSNLYTSKICKLLTLTTNQSQ